MQIIPVHNPIQNLNEMNSKPNNLPVKQFKQHENRGSTKLLTCITRTHTHVHNSNTIVSNTNMGPVLPIIVNGCPANIWKQVPDIAAPKRDSIVPYKLQKVIKKYGISKAPWASAAGGRGEGRGRGPLDFQTWYNYSRERLNSAIFRSFFVDSPWKRLNSAIFGLFLLFFIFFLLPPPPWKFFCWRPWTAIWTELISRKNYCRLQNRIMVVEGFKVQASRISTTTRAELEKAKLEQNILRQ